MSHTIKSGDFGIQAKVNNTIRALKPFTENKGINLSCNFKNDIKDLIIVNSIQIQAILTLLVVNATNSKCREISVEVDLLPSTNQKTNYRILQLIVFDNGIGISAEKVKKINNELRNLHIKSYAVLGTDTIITAILHDVIEDTKLTKEKIAMEFNDNIAEQVLALTRNRGGKKTSSMKMIQTLVNQDKVELLLIKLFDRLDNIKTIFIKPAKRRQEIILETQQEFIPLAEYLKLPEIAIELNKYCELYAT
ncbi:HD domain-containing protein [Orientia tsutsugamushi]|uniref:ATP-binding protein n=1 Tax=Orientia tsutsugamushi TaxID=784 RepID=A0A2U3QNK8_ORITS|nr:HD domain-containing protein [Orientia tsutsugamushi]KJV87827.1 HD domain protein [Orientia tsutsugamushi str. UT76]SPR02548.1 ATP-binding protein [Orientia tsutsugamushi]